MRVNFFSVRTLPSFFLVSLIAALLVAPPTSQAADDEAEDVSESDYERAEQLLSWNLQDTVHRSSVQPRWMEDDAFWYRISIEEGHEFMFADPAESVREPAFDHERLADGLSDAMDEEVEPYDLPFAEFDYEDDRSAISFAYQGHRWHCDLEEYVCEEGEELPEEPPQSILSPNESLAAYTKEHNLWVRDLETGEDIQLTEDGEERYAYAVDSQGWRRSNMPILKWSPDSRRIATFRQDERDTPEMHLLETNVGRPDLESWPYATPGDSDDEVPKLERVVIDVEEETKTFLDVEPDHQRTSNCCGLTRNQQLADNKWSEDGEALAFVSTSRDYNTVTLRLADPETGEVTDIYEETDEPFFESNLQSRGVPNWRVLDDSDRFIWFTRKDGWGHLYLHDLETGEEINRITSGDWNVLDLLHVDEEAQTLLFTAVGKEDGRDPYHTHLYRVNFDGSGLELLTPEAANHTVDVSPSGEHIVNTHSTFSTPPESVVRTSDGEMIMPLEQAEADALYETGWSAPEPFTVKARDGETDLYGIMHKPSDFDPDESYPIINSIYPGPQTGSVGSRSFSTSQRGQAQALAELGFIVIQVDALGTPLRSKEFHTAWYGEMNDNGIPDQKAAMEQLADRYDWIDLDRTGIYGHSGGGYATTTALFQEPDFFHAGVSSAGNHDNRGYTYYWGEKYQGLLEEANDEDTYTNQANQLDAENLEGELLISYGTGDANVHPNMTLLVVDQLIEHNKDFDLVVMPDRGHGYASEPYHIRQTWDHFVRHLLDAEPPHEYEIER